MNAECVLEIKFFIFLTCVQYKFAKFNLEWIFIRISSCFIFLVAVAVVKISSAYDSAKIAA